ncbi:MAG: PrsW family intramembrane metalloprotease [Streptosporangiales bacterium]|nr:PrsW family intramembrane metalloprotease [Streptosporangiales bacterium]
MAEPATVFDPRAVIDGRPPGLRRMYFYVGVVLTAVCAIIALVFYLGESVADGRGVVPFAIALPLAILPVPLLLAAVLWVDRLEPEPRGNLVFAFGWGAGIAALFALLINTAGLDYVTQPALGATTGQFVSATFAAPVVEETLKGAVLVGLLWRRRAEFDGPTDGVVYAGIAGLGFAMMENVGYYINALASPEHGGIALLGYTFVLRGLLSPLLHPLFTSMSGLGVAFAARRRGAGWAVALGWAGAVALHMFWNGMSRFGVPGMVAGYVLMAWVLGVVVAVLVSDRRQLVRLIGEHLPPYGATGLVSPTDVAMLGSLRARHAARNWARATGGVQAAVAMGDYQLACTELALLHDKAGRGVLGGGEFTRRQHELLNLMHWARGAFLLRHGGAPPSAPWAAAGSGSGFASGDVYRAPVPAPPPR